MGLWRNRRYRMVVLQCYNNERVSFRHLLVPGGDDGGRVQSPMVLCSVNDPGSNQVLGAAEPGTADDDGELRDRGWPPARRSVNKLLVGFLAEQVRTSEGPSASHKRLPVAVRLLRWCCCRPQRRILEIHSRHLRQGNSATRVGRDGPAQATKGFRGANQPRQAHDKSIRDVRNQQPSVWGQPFGVDGQCHREGTVRWSVVSIISRAGPAAPLRAGPGSPAPMTPPQ
jgi:hypothetical protein